MPAYALYTDPPLGRAGMTEAEARASGRPLLVSRRPMSQVGRAIEKGETQGLMKLVADAETKRILGAAILGPGRRRGHPRIIDMMSAGQPWPVLQRAVPIHPTVSELIPTLLGTSLRSIDGRKLMESFDVLIVGGGHGGAQTAIALRQLGFAGSIGLSATSRICPMSARRSPRTIWPARRAFERMLIRPAAFWAERAVTIRLGAAGSSAVDPEERTVIALGRRLGSAMAILSGPAGGFPAPGRRRRTRSATAPMSTGSSPPFPALAG